MAYQRHFQVQKFFKNKYKKKLQLKNNPNFSFEF